MRNPSNAINVVLKATGETCYTDVLIGQEGAEPIYTMDAGDRPDVAVHARVGEARLRGVTGARLGALRMEN